MKQAKTLARYKENWLDYRDCVVDVILDAAISIVVLALIPLVFFIVLFGFYPEDDYE